MEVAYIAMFKHKFNKIAALKVTFVLLQKSVPVD